MMGAVLGCWVPLEIGREVGCLAMMILRCQKWVVVFQGAWRPVGIDLRFVTILTCDADGINDPQMILKIIYAIEHHRR